MKINFVVAVLGQAKMHYDKFSRRVILDREYQEEKDTWNNHKNNLSRKWRLRENARSQKKGDVAHALEEVKRNIARVQLEIQHIRAGHTEGTGGKSQTLHEKEFRRRGVRRVMQSGGVASSQSENRNLLRVGRLGRGDKSELSEQHEGSARNDRRHEEDSRIEVQADDENNCAVESKKIFSDAAKDKVEVDNNPCTQSHIVLPAETLSPLKRSETVRRLSRRASMVTGHDMMVDVYNYYQLMYPTRQEALKFVYEDY